MAIVSHRTIRSTSLMALRNCSVSSCSLAHIPIGITPHKNQCLIQSLFFIEGFSRPVQALSRKLGIVFTHANF